MDTDKADAKTQAKHEQMLKDCIAKEQAKNSSQSMEQAKKTCWDQMKARSTDVNK
ncbi:hypothetical protein [Povalibacter sp.]|uniref:hypothetical protein n=1 Tax=Povalibacter sp. TaxID=1962978 RepID=UPI002F4263B9